MYNDIKSVEHARETAIGWQANFDEQNYSYSELSQWQAYFEALGEQFGLTDEFKENGVI